MQRKLRFALLLFYSQASFSQDSIFHLKNYKCRTDGFRALALNLISFPPAIFWGTEPG